PSFSQGEFSFLVELPEGTPLEATDRFVQDVQAALKDDARVDSISGIVGGAGLSLSQTGSEGENAARIQVRLKKGSRRSDEEEVAAILRSRLESSSIARYKFERPSYFTFRTPIEVETYGDNLADLQASAAALKLAQGPAEIRRAGQKRAAIISGDSSGRDMGAVAADVRAAIDRQTFPAGVVAGLSGQEEEMERSFRSLKLAMGLAIFLVY